MISLIQQLAAGNALRVILTPPFGATMMRLLRKDADTFTDQDDATALVIHEGLDRAITDFSGLINGETVWYKPFYLVDSIWQTDDAVSATPGASFEALGPDVVGILRDRLEAGLKVFVDRGVLVHERNYIPVLKSSPQAEAIPLPLVTVHLTNQSEEVRGIGEETGEAVFDEEDGLWHSVEGSLDRFTIGIVAWSLNSDERINLRKAMRDVFNVNLPIFEAAGMTLCQWSFNDVEDYETYAAPMYQAIGQFSCLAPAAISFTDPAISDVISVPVIAEVIL